jgi:hypothetical protein
MGTGVNWAGSTLPAREPQVWAQQPPVLGGSDRRACDTGPFLSASTSAVKRLAARGSSGAPASFDAFNSTEFIFVFPLRCSALALPRG